MLGLARRGQTFELVQDVLAGVRYHPVTSRHECLFVWDMGTAHRISESFSSMARCSACFTAICRRSDSQGHSGKAGALQMAQFGAASISARSQSVAAGIITEHPVGENDVCGDDDGCPCAVQYSRGGERAGRGKKA